MNFTRDITLLPRTTRQLSEALLPATLSAQTHFTFLGWAYPNSIKGKSQEILLRFSISIIEVFNSLAFFNKNPHCPLLTFHKAPEEKPRIFSVYFADCQRTMF